MGVLTTGYTFSSNEQVTSSKLNNIANSATFNAAAVDDATTQLSGGSIIVKTIQTGNIATGAVTTEKIPDSAITAAKIASDAVTTAKILDSNVTTAKIADANVTPAKLSQPITRGTAQNSTSGTSIDFTGIPSWVKRVTVMLNGVSTSGTNPMQAQLGTSGGVESTGYAASNSGLAVIGNTNVTSTSGFYLTVSASYQTAANQYSGNIVFNNVSGNIWVCSASIGGTTTAQSFIANGSKTLTGTLDRIRLTTSTGVDTFDAGSINIIYE